VEALLLPDGSSLSLRDGMPGTDPVGAAGYHDQVHNHYLRAFGNALVLSVIGAGVQLSQIQSSARTSVGPPRATCSGRPSASSSGRRRRSSFRRGMSLAPTLDDRPGFRFNVMVTQDAIFPRPYKEATSR
jgi:type IV secretion system protein TrbI